MNELHFFPPLKACLIQAGFFFTVFVWELAGIHVLEYKEAESKGSL